MSVAPAPLKELRRYLLAITGNTERGNFGIASGVSAKRNQGYHLGKSDIFGEGGLGWKDYSIQRPRDKAGLTDAAAAIDIKLPISELKKLAAFLVAEAKAGRAPDLVQVIGPGSDGRAYEWNKGSWGSPIRRAVGDGHEWHIHLSFHRDSENRDKVILFRLFFEPELFTGDSPEVRLWQERLNAHGFPVTIDGFMGPETDEAIRTFQRTKGLHADGVVGEATLAALQADPAVEEDPAVTQLKTDLALAVSALERLGRENAGLSAEISKLQNAVLTARKPLNEVVVSP